MNNNFFNNTTINQINKIRQENPNKTIGFTCSCFDLLHTGHLIMLREASDICDILVVGLQTDPTIDRVDKNKPVQSFYERELMISSLKYINHIIVYATEDDLYNILKELKPNIRIIGSDWRNKTYTGCDLDYIPMHWHERTHNYSTSNLRKRIFDAESEKNENNTNV
jgi:glycerol-3-phosphate cytidylyltransferase